MSETATTETASLPKTDAKLGLTAVKGRRRPWLWAVAVLMIALGSLLAGGVVHMLKDTIPVVATAQAIQRGHKITEADLKVVEVRPDPGLATLDAAAKDQLLGQVALTSIPQGQLMNPGVVGETVVPGEGKSLVGVALTPPQRPASELTPGSIVLVVSTPRNGDDPSPDAPAVRVEGVIVSVTDDAETNLAIVDLAVPTAESELVASLSASGRVALIVKEA